MKNKLEECFVFCQPLIKIWSGTYYCFRFVGHTSETMEHGAHQRIFRFVGHIGKPY